MSNTAFDDRENLKPFQEVREEFKKVNPLDLAKNPGTALFRFWVLRLLLGCYRELDSLSYLARKQGGGR